MTTETKFNFVPGAILPNGATLLTARQHWRGGYVVLAHWQGGRGDEYVTWRAHEDGSCYWGHYCSGDGAFDCATEDFKTR